MTLVLYAFATRVRSSRAIERHCGQDVAYRVVTGNLLPDHATIARFVARHEQALADLFGEVLRLCGEAGLVKPEVIAIDGTRMAGNANSDATRDFGQLAREILAEHKATDEAEDAVMSCPSSCARPRGGASSSATPARSCGTSRPKSGSLPVGDCPSRS